MSCTSTRDNQAFSARRIRSRRKKFAHPLELHVPKSSFSAEGASRALRAESPPGLMNLPPKGGSTLLLQEDDMRTIDFSPLYRSAVGFDRMAGLLDAAARTSDPNGWPPYNIEQSGENAYRVEIAVAGFTSDDLAIELKEGQLIVTGEKTARPESQNEKTYLHRGLAQRAFELRFQLADHVLVRDARLELGLLTISLERELPEALKPRRIEISTAPLSRVQDQRAA
jgi:molecular chaperone IbpA